MKFYELRYILERGGKLRKSYWGNESHLILKEKYLLLRYCPVRKNYYDYELDYKSVFTDDWEEVVAIPKLHRTGFGLDPMENSSWNLEKTGLN